MVTGVSTGFTKVLEISAESVGYRAEMTGKNLMLYLGYSHPIEFPPPDGITFVADPKTRTITISGIDKELVGEIAARCASCARQSLTRAKASDIRAKLSAARLARLARRARAASSVQPVPAPAPSCFGCWMRAGTMWRCVSGRGPDPRVESPATERLKNNGTCRPNRGDVSAGAVACAQR